MHFIIISTILELFSNTVAIFYKITDVHFTNRCFFQALFLSGEHCKIYLGRIVMLNFRRICSGQIPHRFTLQVSTQQFVQTVVLYCGRVPAANVPDALQPKDYCTNPGL